MSLLETAATTRSHARAHAHVVLFSEASEAVRELRSRADGRAQRASVRDVRHPPYACEKRRGESGFAIFVTVYRRVPEKCMESLINTEMTVRQGSRGCAQ